MGITEVQQIHVRDLFDLSSLNGQAGTRVDGKDCMVNAKK